LKEIGSDPGVTTGIGLPYRDSVKRNMPREWFSKARHTHVALDDAIEQGQLFCAMLAARGECLG
jgi:hypothetical protein